MRRAALVIGLAGLAGFGLVPNDPNPVPGKDPVVSDCLPPFAFDGESTLDELGVTDQQPGFDLMANRRGRIRITGATVRWEEFAPPDVAVVVPEGQMLCVTWPDGSGMSMLLSEPFGEGAAEDAPEEMEIPIATIAVLLGVLVAGGISWLAFRGEAPPES